MKQSLACGILALALGIFPGGCTNVYWEKDWHYEGTKQDVERFQSVTISSEPPGAHVFLDDGEQPIGETPLTENLSYRVVRTELIKRQYKEESGTKTVQETKTRVIETPVSKPYTVTLSLEGFRDARRTLIVPLSNSTVHVRLRESGVINNIACSLLVEARSEYFVEIDKVIEPFAGADKEFRPEDKEKVEITPETPDLDDARSDEIRKLNAQDIRVFVYNMQVVDSDAFDDMVSQLRELASSKGFVFEIYDAHYNAKFTTNVLDTGIQHVVVGRRRAGAKLYLVQSGVLKRVPEAAFTGDKFATQVMLKPNERYVYLISAFKKGRAVLLVYKQLDVFAQSEEEIEKVSEFVDLSGVDEDEIARIRDSF